jgi:hypothetical protein
MKAMKPVKLMKKGLRSCLMLFFMVFTGFMSFM